MVEPSFAKHVDSVTSSYASLRESLLMSQQRASVKAAGLEAARDDVETMRAQMQQLEAARLEAEARATAAEEIAQRQGEQLAAFNQKLRVATSAAVGLQCVIDQSRAQLVELRQLVTGEGPEELVGAVDIEGSQLDCVDGLWTFVDAMEKIASEQYDRTAKALDEQAEESKQLALESRLAHIDKLRMTAASERIRQLAQRKYGWRRVSTEEMGWEALWESRQRKLKARFVFEDEAHEVVKAVVMGTDGGKEVLEVTDEEKAAADKLKKERQREAAKEKLRAMKAKKRLKQAEQAAREAAEAAELEAARAAEEAAAAAAEPEPANDFMNSLMGGDEPEPGGSGSGSGSGSESEEVRTQEPCHDTSPTPGATLAPNFQGGALGPLRWWRLPLPPVLRVCLAPFRSRSRLSRARLSFVRRRTTS